MRFLSLFSGIEAFSVATAPLGWECVAVAEIEPFPCKVLKYHYPDVPNLGDITKITESDIRALGHIDLIVGGFPCQDVSSAGKRKGFLNDDGTPTRSGLFFAAVRICEWSSARFVVLENVPGLYSSSHGRDFAAVVGEMAGCEFDTPKGGWQNSGVALGPLGLVEWITLDAQYVRTRQFPRAVPQRRRRVFVVRDSGNWSSRPPLFLEQSGMLGDPPPIRKAREDIATDVTRGVAGTVGARTGLSIGAQDAMNGHLLPVTYDRQSNCEYGSSDIASTMSARDYKSPSDLVTYAIAGNIIGRADGNGGNGLGFSADGESYTLTKTDVHAVCYPINTQIATRHEAMGEGTGMGIAADPSAAYTLQSAHSHAVAFGHVDYENNGYNMESAAGPLMKGSQSGGGRPLPAVAYSFDSMSSNSMKSSNPHSGVNTVDVAKTLDTSALNPTCNQGGMTAMPPFAPEPCICAMIPMGDECPICGFVTQPDEMRFSPDQHFQIRRLTPEECESLQGFRCGYTNVPGASDTTRYRALGNSMATNVMEYIATRIDTAVNYAILNP